MAEEKQQEEPYITDSAGNKIRVSSVMNAYQIKINTLLNENITLTAKLQDLERNKKEAPKLQSKQK